MAKSKDRPFAGPRGRDEDRGSWQGGQGGQEPGRDRNEDDRIYGARSAGGGPEWDRPSQPSGQDGGYREGGLGEGGTGQRGYGTGYGYGSGQRRYGLGGFTGAYGAGGPEHGRGGGMGPGGMGEGGYGQDAQRGQGWGGRDYGTGGGTGERGHGEGGYAQGYGGRGYGDRGQGQRGFLERAGDEVSSWFGDEDARQRREADHRGKGPRGYRRSDDRIREDVNDRLSDDPGVDASDIEVTVENGEVTLTGEVSSRQEKRSAEDCVERVSGVGHVQNNLRVRSATTASSQSAPSGQTGRGSQL